jgi:hypothetical protein
VLRVEAINSVEQTIGACVTFDLYLEPDGVQRRLFRRPKAFGEFDPWFICWYPKIEVPISDRRIVCPYIIMSILDRTLLLD